MWLQTKIQNIFTLLLKINERQIRLFLYKTMQVSMLDGGSGLEEVIIKYFEELLSASNIEWESATMCMPSKITREMNEEILAKVDENEVKKALFNMHLDKSPGPYGMSLGFYQNFWKIVGNDAVLEVNRFFET